MKHGNHHITLHRHDIEVDGNQVTNLSIYSITNQQSIASVCLKHIDRRIAVIHRLFVSLGYRQEGFGRKLIDECCVIAKASHCTALSLLVNVKNTDAQAFYYRLGFQCAYQDPDDYIFSLQLTEKPPTIPPARIIELATRLVAPGEKAANISASETHEIADYIFSLEPQ